MICCIFVAVSIGVLLLRRGSNAVVLNELEGFWKCLELLTETIREFFKNTYSLHVTSFENEKINCNVFSLDALDKFRNDVSNGSASLNIDKALDLIETDPVVHLELSAREYFRAKEFLSSLDGSDYQQM